MDLVRVRDERAKLYMWWGVRGELAVDIRFKEFVWANIVDGWTCFDNTQFVLGVMRCSDFNPNNGVHMWSMVVTLSTWCVNVWLSVQICVVRGWSIYVSCYCTQLTLPVSLLKQTDNKLSSDDKSELKTKLQGIKGLKIFLWIIEGCDVVTKLGSENKVSHFI